MVIFRGLKLSFFFLSVTPCTVKPEQHCALLKAHFGFLALKEGPSCADGSAETWKQADQLSVTEEPARESEKGKFHRLIF